MNQQTAPYPDELDDLVSKLKLDPDWTVILKDIDRGQGSVGLTLDITTRGYDTYHPERGRYYGVHHYFIVPAASYNRSSWQRWLFDRYIDVLTHEGMEFFQVDGERPYAPNHGPGEDPYVIHDDTTDLARRTKFTGKVHDG